MLCSKRPLVLISTLFLCSTCWSQFGGTGSQNPLDPQQQSATGLSGDQTNPQTGQAGDVAPATLPACSAAQYGQPCIKDSSADQTTGRPYTPTITSGPDETEGTPSQNPEEQRPPGSPPRPGQNANPNAKPDSSAGTAKLPNEQQMNTGTKPVLSEFQQFVATATGKTLPLFGHDLFKEPPTTFAAITDIPVTADYVLGPGDQVVIRAWGQIEVNYKATIDRTGSIYVPKVGEIKLAGIRYADVNEYLRRQIGQVYRNFVVDVSLAKLRSIQVIVVGQVKQPGRYTVSGLSTLLNAVFASGGPSDYGSLRHIQLRRGGQLVQDFDLYDLLLRGDRSKDVPLQNEDVIYVPHIGPQVAVVGSVPVPAVYELRGESSLKEVLEFAGGLATTAEGLHVSIERIEEHRVRRIDQVGLNANGEAFPLKDGDIVTVFPLQPRFENSIVLRGNVAVPGRYPWRQGMRVSDLIPSRDALLTRDYWLKLNSSARSTTRGQEQLRNQIARTAPEINWDYAVIQRLLPERLTATLIPFNLGKAIEHDAANDPALQPGDVITIFSQADIQVPVEHQSKYVRLEGEIVTSGVYKAEPGETLRHLLQRVGGLAPSAYLYGAEFTRESVRRDQQLKLDRVSQRFSADVERSASYTSQNITNPADAASLPARIESQRRLAAQLQNVKATGRIVLNIKPDSTALTDVPDMPLEDGDRLIVPYRPATVSVLGAVNDQADFMYRRGARVADYLRQAGGATQTGDRRRIYILRANGSVTGAQAHSGVFSSSIMSEHLYPGDAIVVPERINKTTFTKSLIEYSQILYQLGLSAAAIKVLSP